MVFSDRFNWIGWLFTLLTSTVPTFPPEDRRASDLESKMAGEKAAKTGASGEIKEGRKGEYCMPQFSRAFAPAILDSRLLARQSSRGKVGNTRSLLHTTAFQSEFHTSLCMRTSNFDCRHHIPFLCILKSHNTCPFFTLSVFKTLTRLKLYTRRFCWSRCTNKCTPLIYECA